MFISHKYQAIFVHIQRSGGNSVHQVFAEHDPGLIEAVPVDPAKQRTKHCFAIDLRDAIDPVTFAGYTKFGIVRNPYERLVSWYHHLRDGRNAGDAEIKLAGHPVLLRLYYAGLRALSNTRYVALYTEASVRGLRWMTRSPPNSADEMALRFGSIGERVKREVANQARTFGEFVRLPRGYPGGIFERFHANQLDYLADGETLLVDRVLRFERLGDEFAVLARELGFPGRLPHVNQSSRGASHRTSYDDATRAVIAERFRRDLERFGYEF